MASDEWVTDDLYIVRTAADAPVIMSRHFDDGSGPQTFSIAADELDAVIERLEGVADGE